MKLKFITDALLKKTVMEKIGSGSTTKGEKSKAKCKMLLNDERQIRNN